MAEGDIPQPSPAFIGYLMAIDCCAAMLSCAPTRVHLAPYKQGNSVQDVGDHKSLDKNCPISIQTESKREQG